MIVLLGSWMFPSSLIWSTTTNDLLSISNFSMTCDGCGMLRYFITSATTTNQRLIVAL